MIFEASAHRSSRFVCAAVALIGVSCSAGSDTLVVGSKNFTEQDILGEIVATWIEHTTDIQVRRRLHLGGTFLCHQAILSGDIDLYVEYTGTALAAILEESGLQDPDSVRRRVSDVYSERYGLLWTGPLGFENTFALLVRASTADSLNLRTVSEAAPHTVAWTPGFGYEFAERADGFAGLSKAYGLEFGSAARVMDLGLTYRALASGQVDFIAGNSTDGQIDALGLRQLRDDRGYFPPYEAVPVVRKVALERFPQLEASLASLSGRLSTAEMRRLNRAVDVEGERWRDVARDWVEEELRSGERNMDRP